MGRCNADPHLVELKTAILDYEHRALLGRLGSRFDDYRGLSAPSVRIGPRHAYTPYARRRVSETELLSTGHRADRRAARRASAAYRTPGR